MVILALLSTFVLIGIDQALKIWAVQSLAAVETIPLIQDALHLTYVENRGAAFNIMEGRTWFLVGVTSLILIVGLIALFSGKIRQPILLCTITLILAGGAGNLIDRVFRGFVVDYIDFRLIHFAVFNFADCCVVIGTILLAGYILLFEDGKRKRKPVEPPEERNEGDSLE